jgi:2',3'-cyclic-nucleotide 2'-phosphodiesterase (5'-nucleotidase family)
VAGGRGCDEACRSGYPCGFIRARIQAGEVTWGELFAVQPFANDLVKMDLTGGQIWTLLGRQFQTPSNRILEISGLHYRYHLTSPTTGVIDAVCVGPPGDDSQPVPNDASVTYTVMVNSFLAGGGDGFTVLRDGINRVVGPVDLDALVEYVQGLPTPFTSQIEDRIELTPSAPRRDGGWVRVAIGSLLSSQSRQSSQPWRWGIPPRAATLRGGGVGVRGGGGTR